MLLDIVLEGNPIACCRILEESSPSISALWKYIIFLEGSKYRVRLNRIIEYIMGRSIKILKSLAALVKLEDDIWDSVEEDGRFVFGIHGNYELTSNINEWKMLAM